MTCRKTAPSASRKNRVIGTPANILLLGAKRCEKNLVGGEASPVQRKLDHTVGATNRG